MLRRRGKLGRSRVGRIWIALGSDLRGLLGFGGYFESRLFFFPLFLFSFPLLLCVCVCVCVREREREREEREREIERERERGAPSLCNKRGTCFPFLHHHHHHHHRSSSFSTPYLPLSPLVVPFLRSGDQLLGTFRVLFRIQ